MVHGIELFRAFYEKHSDKYVVIGGTACSIAMDQLGEEFRATKDVDMVLTLEALDKNFYQDFWRFIKEGGYSAFNKSAGKDKFYRFHSPTNKDFPSMIEIFAPDLEESYSSDTFPIRGEVIEGDETISLSAILLDKDYYGLIQSGKVVLEGISTLMAEQLILLKGKAWLDLTNRKETGESVDSKNIRKHRNDILRLHALLTPGNKIQLPKSIKQDAATWMTKLAAEKLDLRDLNISTPIEKIIADLTEAFL